MQQPDCTGQRGMAAFGARHASPSVTGCLHTSNQSTAASSWLPQQHSTKTTNSTNPTRRTTPELPTNVLPSISTVSHCWCSSAPLFGPAGWEATTSVLQLVCYALLRPAWYRVLKFEGSGGFVVISIQGLTAH